MGVLGVGMTESDTAYGWEVVTPAQSIPWQLEASKKLWSIRDMVIEVEIDLMERGDNSLANQLHRAVDMLADAANTMRGGDEERAANLAIDAYDHICDMRPGTVSVTMLACDLKPALQDAGVLETELYPQSIYDV